MSPQNCLAVLSLGLTITACSPSPPLQIPAVMYDKVGDYHILEKIPATERSSLEELLTKPSEPSLDEEGIIELEVSEARFPEILYHVHQESGKLVVQSLGSSFLLNAEGYFLTAHHVFEDSLKDHEQGADNCFMLLYDPIEGFAASARPLIFSIKDDILLGKIDVIKPRETTLLSDSTQPLQDLVYSITYSNTSYLAGELFSEVEKSGSVDADHHFQQLHPFPVEKSIFKTEVSMGHLVGVIEAGKKINNHGVSSFVASMIPGNSGSPVFDLRNSQVGVVTSIYEKSDPTLAIYTNSSRLRPMIETYLNQAIE
ncbi:MAG: trypsin-like peptidase domain-containing protein [Nanoarchaeota archaeon]|nr:trypsin-like peptidase domain-containing protein [Nanoarchaeota archaeon]